MGQNIGFLGGTFNPIHYGHLLLAEAAREQFNLDLVLFIPNSVPPHRDSTGSELLEDAQRYVMTILATLSNPCFRVSRIELDRKGPSYTYDTLVLLRQQNPENQYYFIGGADSLIQHSWFRFDDLLEALDGFLLTSRGKDTVENAREKVNKTTPRFSHKIKEIQMAPVSISATEIRDRLRKGRSIRYLVPESVEQYIQKEKLYAEVYQR